MSADEPRRSGRATKGQHTKNFEVEVPVPMRQTKAKPRRRPKTEDGGDDGDDEEAFIRCVCGAEAGDSGGMMVCCDKCSCWQHNRCMGFPQDKKALPEAYLCEMCNPEGHQQLLEKMGRGEKPWEGRGWKRQPQPDKGARAKNNGAAKKQDTPKKDEPTEAAEAPGTVHSQPAPEAPVVKKRKSRGEEPEGAARNGQVEPQAKVRKVQDPPPAKPAMSPPPLPKLDTRKAKPNANAGPAVKGPTSKAAAKPKDKPESEQDINQTELVGRVGELLNELRRRSAELLANKIIGVISEDAGGGKYPIPEGSTAQSLGTRLGIEVERAVHLKYSNKAGDPSPAYRQRVRTLIFNVAKNHALCEGLVRGTLTPDVLSEMSSDALASEELQRRDAEMRRESEKQHILIREDGPRIRRTHKGEEIVGGDTEQGDTGDSVFTAAPSHRRDSGVVPDTPVTASSGHGMSPQTPRSTTFSDGAALGTYGSATSPADLRALTIDTQAGSGRSGVHERKQSSTFEMQEQWSNVQSPEEAGSRPHSTSHIEKLPYETTRGVIEGVGSVAADPEIDELLKGDEAESPPYSPTEHPVDPSEIWRGKVTMSNVGEFTGTAKHVAGADLSATVPWSELIPEPLRVDGRIMAERATKYLCELRYSRTTDVIVIAIRPGGGPRSMDEFDRVWTYFSTRGRYGVVTKNNHAGVKDTYVIPVDAGSGKLPVFMEMLEYNKLDEPRQERVILVTFVFKNTPRDASAAGADAALPQTPTPITAVAPGSAALPGGGAFTPAQSQTPPYDPASRGAGGIDNSTSRPASSSTAPTVLPQYGGSTYDFPTIVPAPAAPAAAVSSASAVTQSTVPQMPTAAVVATAPSLTPVAGPVSASAPQATSSMGSPTYPHAAIAAGAATGAAQQPSTTLSLATRVLGPLVDSSVMRQLFAQSAEMSVAQLTVIKEILERVPAARDDIGLFTQLLTEKGRNQVR